ncbi:Excreted virulence factor EspC, type VII ESX diderm [Micromonospora pallida]|uniref:Excreted virulence factor EspC, type VII ESX diderm n=1 Tax=Micromonospora pallida TaxID=145854 RepID=A0A1C6T5Z1_9ACTN|nr:type VII secretion target [Micromonospora pallida]SCL36943.1 Excreted virulence factor EspC, type VII ESX diderm [Micromonospora pallida]
MTEVRVEPEVLEKTSHVCDDLRDDLRRSAADIEDDTQAALSGLPGWQTRTALEQLRWSWSDDLTKLTGHISNIGDALRGCARDYRYSDVASAALFDIRER